VKGIVSGEGALASDEPVKFEAITDTVYDTPLVSPEIVHEVESPLVVVHVPAMFPPLSTAVAVELVMARPPLKLGPDHETPRVRFPAIATTAVGESGDREGVTATEFAEEEPAPAALVAVTANE